MGWPRGADRWRVVLGSGESGQFGWKGCDGGVASRWLGGSTLEVEEWIYGNCVNWFRRVDDRVRLQVVWSDLLVKEVRWSGLKSKVRREQGLRSLFRELSYRTNVRSLLSSLLVTMQVPSDDLHTCQRNPELQVEAAAKQSIPLCALEEIILFCGGMYVLFVV